METTMVFIIVTAILICAGYRERWRCKKVNCRKTWGLYQDGLDNPDKITGFKCRFCGGIEGEPETQKPTNHGIRKEELERRWF